MKKSEKAYFCSFCEFTEVTYFGLLIEGENVFFVKIH